MIEGKCDKCGFWPTLDYSCLRCTETERDAALLQVSGIREACAKIAEEIRDEAPEDQRGSFSARWVATTRVAERIRQQGCEHDWEWAGDPAVEVCSKCHLVKNA